MTSRGTVSLETSQRWSNNYSHFLIKTSFTMLTRAHNSPLRCQIKFIMLIMMIIIISSLVKITLPYTPRCPILPLTFNMFYQTSSRNSHLCRHLCIPLTQLFDLKGLTLIMFEEGTDCEAKLVP